jgi:hypothetical protein
MQTIERERLLRNDRPVLRIKGKCTNFDTPHRPIGSEIDRQPDQANEACKNQIEIEIL